MHLALRALPLRPAQRCRGQGTCPTHFGGGRRPGLRALGFQPPLLEVEVRQHAEDDVELCAEEQSDVGGVAGPRGKYTLGPLLGWALSRNKSESSLKSSLKLKIK